MDEDKLKIELINKDKVINALIQIMCEYSIEPDVQSEIILCLLNMQADIEYEIANKNEVLRGNKYMSTENMIRELRRLCELHKNDKVSTCETNWSALCSDTADRLEELLEYKYMYESLNK